MVLTHGARINLEPYANSGSRFYVENFAAACDTAGEWFLDTNTATLLWQPRNPGEDPRSLEFIAPYIEGELLLLDGAVGVTVEGQSFQHADWSMYPTNVSSGSCQAASFLNHSAVHLRNARDCVLSNVTVEHVGQYGMWIEDHSTNNTVVGSITHDTGAGACFMHCSSQHHDCFILLLCRWDPCRDREASCSRRGSLAAGWV